MRITKRQLRQIIREASYDDDGDLTLDPDGLQRKMFDFLTGPGGILMV